MLFFQAYFEITVRQKQKEGELIMAMWGEGRLTLSLMSFLCAGCLFSGSGSPTVDVGGLRTSSKERRAGYIKVCQTEHHMNTAMLRNVQGHESDRL